MLKLHLYIAKLEYKEKGQYTSPTNRPTIPVDNANKKNHTQQPTTAQAWPFGLADCWLPGAAAPNSSLAPGVYVGSWLVELGAGVEDFVAVSNYRTRPYYLQIKLILWRTWPSPEAADATKD